jgi:hypothetical protein
MIQGVQHPAFPCQPRMHHYVTCTHIIDRGSTYAAPRKHAQQQQIRACPVCSAAGTSVGQVANYRGRIDFYPPLRTCGDGIVTYGQESCDVLATQSPYTGVLGCAHAVVPAYCMCRPSQPLLSRLCTAQSLLLHCKAALNACPWHCFALCLLPHIDADTCSSSCLLINNLNRFRFEMTNDGGRVRLALPPLGYPLSFQFQARGRMHAHTMELLQLRSWHAHTQGHAATSGVHMDHCV